MIQVVLIPAMFGILSIYLITRNWLTTAITGVIGFALTYQMYLDDRAEDDD